jgi:hypothetical protein
MRFFCSTLFDITATGVTGTYKAAHATDPSAWNRARNQQRNWETITQLIGMRTQLYNVTTPIRAGNQWRFEFEVETPAVFGSADNPVALLKNDAIGVPMLTDLDNESGLDSRLIPDHNIWFSIIPINTL